MKQLISKICIAVGIGMPIPVFAAGKTLSDLIQLTAGYIKSFTSLIILLAVLIFVWNVYKYFIAADAENRKEAATYVMYSIIGFFIILSFWGLVNILTNTLKLDTTDPSRTGSSNSAGTNRYVPASGTSFGGYDSEANPNGGGVQLPSDTGSGNYDSEANPFGNPKPVSPNSAPKPAPSGGGSDTEVVI